MNPTRSALVVGLVAGLTALSACTQSATRIQGSIDFEGSESSGVQVLLWAGTTEIPVGLHPRPTGELTTHDDHFELDVEPGTHLVRVTELDGDACGEVAVEIRAGQSVNVDFDCP